MGKVAELHARVDIISKRQEELTEMFRSADGDVHTAEALARANLRAMEALRATQIEHGDALAGLTVGQAQLNTKVAGIETEISGIKTEITGIKTEISGIHVTLAEVLRRLPEPPSA
jgi:hypothetical protein